MAQPTLEKLDKFIPGASYMLPEHQLTEAEIMEFARFFDPQAIHLDKEKAKASIFGDIIASGLHPYITLHREYWVPMIEHNFICGVSIDGAEFFKPVYANQPFCGRLTILSTEPKPNKGTVVVHWQLEVLSPTLEVLHIVRYGSYHYSQLS